MRVVHADVVLRMHRRLVVSLVVPSPPSNRLAVVSSEVAVRLVRQHSAEHPTRGHSHSRTRVPSEASLGGPKRTLRLPHNPRVVCFGGGFGTTNTTLGQPQQNQQTGAACLAPLWASSLRTNSMTAPTFPGRRSLLGRGVSAPASDNQSSRNATQLQTSAGQSPRRKPWKTGFNRLIDALEITKELSSACEPLEIAVSALLVVLKALKKYIDTMEAVEALLARMESLRGMLEKVTKAGYANCPPMFKERLDIFARYAAMLPGWSVVDEAEALQSQQRMVRFINASDYMEKLEDWIKKLSWHVQSFILEGTITLELTVYEMAADVRQISKQMGERFDQVDNGIISKPSN
ncbi:hypothetical protein NUW54_g2289 [Trametes sanguinea]|uniref:Uncharacterized protein n=1 Tax=Trametes sanguinea TaxID=158606 RepID=A0ACC1Q4K4_9APHY|nr:hypothetical protein NUW54_g2289 [Trametes sanguinea]